jgi:hypothetical protein
MAGAALPESVRATVDGVSLVPLLKGGESLPRDAIYWHYPHYHPGGATPYGAVRKGDWKLIEFFEDSHVELYNLREDIGEKTNLVQTKPQEAASLRAQLHAWRAAVGAQMPSPNPQYDPDRKGGKPSRGAAKPHDRRPGTHPSFAILRGGTVKRSDYGWELKTKGEVTALQMLGSPVRSRTRFRCRTTTRLKREDGWQNAFLAFSPTGKDKDLLVAGFYIGGLRLAAWHGLSTAPKGLVEAPVAVENRQQEFELVADVDPVGRKLTLSTAGAKVAIPIPKGWGPITHVGFHVMQTTTGFREIRMEEH